MSACRLTANLMSVYQKTCRESSTQNEGDFFGENYFHVTLTIFTPLYSWKSKNFDHLAKTTLAPGAYSQFQNLYGSVLHFSDAFQEQEWIIERGTSSARWRVAQWNFDICWFVVFCQENRHWLADHHGDHMLSIFGIIKSPPP